MCDENYLDLCNAVIEKGIEDWKNSSERTRKYIEKELKLTPFNYGINLEYIFQQIREEEDVKKKTNKTSI